MNLTGRKGTIVIVVLAVSICVNLLLAGLMAGQHWRGGPGRMGLLRDIPPAAEPVAKQVMDANSAELDTRRGAVDAARQNLAAALKADPFDPAKLDAALAEVDQRIGELIQVNQRMMVEVAQKLPDDQRKAWAAKMEERRWKKPD